MEGAPSQLDLFDPKPGSAEVERQAAAALRDQGPASWPSSSPPPRCCASPRKFKPYGQCGIEFSDYIPHIASCADDICLVRSMHTDAFNHHPGQLLLMSGSIQFGRPTLGAWVTLRLGSESQKLPGFVVLSSGRGHQRRRSNNWSSGFLPVHLPGRDVSQLRRSRSCTSPIRLASRRETQRARLERCGI